MSKYEKFLSVAFLILLMSSAFGLFYGLKSVDALNARIETLGSSLQKLSKNNKDISNDYIYKEEFKEDYYITQLDREMNLMLMAIAALVAGFGVITFVNFEARLNSFKANNEQKHIDNENKYHELRNELLKLDSEKNLQLFLSFSAQANIFESDEKYEMSTSLNMLALVSGTNHDKWVKDNNNDFESKYIKDMLSNIDALIDKHNLKNKAAYMFSKALINNLEYLELKELSELALKVRYKLMPKEDK